MEYSFSWFFLLPLTTFLPPYLIPHGILWHAVRRSARFAELENRWTNFHEI
jgi:hypothetical protein